MKNDLFHKYIEIKEDDRLKYGKKGLEFKANYNEELKILKDKETNNVKR